MSLRDELKGMAGGFRWGRRPLVPRSAEPHTPPREDEVFPTDWARTGRRHGHPARILNVGPPSAAAQPALAAGLRLGNLRADGRRA